MEKGELYEKDDRLLAEAMHTLKNMVTPITAYSEMIQYGMKFNKLKLKLQVRQLLMLID